MREEIRRKTTSIRAGEEEFDTTKEIQLPPRAGREGEDQIVWLLLD
jgi:hypothetical protein